MLSNVDAQQSVDQSTVMTPENVTSNIESKNVESQSDDIGEYPSAINQGQLFSIIENGEFHFE